MKQKSGDMMVFAGNQISLLEYSKTGFFFKIPHSHVMSSNSKLPAAKKIDSISCDQKHNK